MKNLKQLRGTGQALARRQSDKAARAVPVAATEAGYVSFHGLVALLWERKWLVAAGLALGLAAGVTLALVQKPVYRATTTVEIQIPNDDYLNRRQLDPSLPTGMLNLDPFLQTEMKRLTSDGLLWTVAEELKLTEQAEFQAKPGKKKLTQGPLLEMLHQRLAVRPAGQAQVAEISFEAQDARFAAAFANRLVEKYRQQSLERRRATATASADLMASQLSTLEQALETSKLRLQRFVRTKGVMSGLDREGLAEARLRQVQAAHVAAQEARITEEARFHETTARAAGELDNDTLAKLGVQLTELRRRHAEAAEIFQPAHFKVRQIEAEIAAVERSMANERANVMGRMKTQLSAAARRERTIEQDLNRQSGVAAAEVASEVDFTSLKHEVEGNQALYDSLQQKVREARLAAAVPSSTVMVLDAAAVPFEPVRPKKMLLVAIGGFCGSLMGLLLVLGTASGAAQPQHTAALAPTPLIPRLGLIPRFENGLTEDPELGVARHPDSPFAESFRRLASRVYTTHAHVWPRILVVSGFEAKQGRTTVAANLAMTLAAEGQNVLLVDADGMNRHVQMRMGIQGGRMLEASPANGLQTPVCSVWMTSIAGLSVARMNGVAAFGADGQYLQELESHYDAVVVDAPLVSQWPDELWSHRFADGLLLVAGRDAIAMPVMAGVVPVLGSVGNAAARGRELGAAERRKLA